MPYLVSGLHRRRATARVKKTRVQILVHRGYAGKEQFAAHGARKAHEVKHAKVLVVVSCVIQATSHPSNVATHYYRSVFIIGMHTLK